MLRFNFTYYVKIIVSVYRIDEECLDDAFVLKPKSMYCWLTRIMYNRRSKFDPFWNNFIVGGLQVSIKQFLNRFHIATSFKPKKF